MEDQAGLAERFDRSRDHLRAVAFRMLGSAEEADDAVQETWLRASRGGAGAVVNLTGWLTTIVGRVCLDMLRARRRRREESADMVELEFRVADDDAADPEGAAVLADSVGQALLVVLDRLGPAERVAFVLHDLFAVPFTEIAEIVERSPVATKKLASRARNRVRGAAAVPAAELAGQRAIVDAFLAAARTGDLDALLAVLAPGVVRRADRVVLPPDAAAELKGAPAVAQEITVLGRRARFAEPALVNGAVGVVVAPAGRLILALTFVVEEGRIAEFEVIADPSRLLGLDLAVLSHPADGSPASSG